MWLKNTNKDTFAESWSIILNPLQEEIKKRSAIQQLQVFFSVTLEESKELIENTPIILLDSLSEESAEKIKDIFVGSGLDVVITSEIMVKRKCFRTVWPKEPTAEQILRQGILRNSLSQKEKSQSVAQSSAKYQSPSLPSAKIEKLKADKTDAPSETASVIPNTTKNGGVENTNQGFGKTLKEIEEKNKKLEVEKTRVQELLLDSQKENEELREIKKEYEKLKKDITEYRSQREQFEGTKIEYETWVRELQEEKSKLEYRIRNLSTDLTGKENQYSDLRGQIDRYKAENDRLKQELTKEMQSVKHYIDLSKKREAELEKIAREIEKKEDILQNRDQQIHDLTQKLLTTDSSKENLLHDLEKKESMIRDSALSIEEMRKEKKLLENQFTEELKKKDQLISQINDKAVKTYQSFEEMRGRNVKVEEELESKRHELDELKKELDFIRERFDVEKKMAEKRFKEKSDQFDQLKDAYDTQSQAQESKINSLSSELNDLTQSYQKTLRAFEEIRQESTLLKKELGEKTKLSEELFYNLSETKKNLEGLTIQFEVLSKESESLAGRFERSQISFEQACNKINALEAENEELKQIATDLNERVKRIPELENLNKRYENQLEIAQRHIKDVTMQREQQEIVEKRLRLQNELQEKELQFKQLAQKQEQLEQDVIARQEMIKKILEEQEAIQKEIIKSKQSQKHLLEIVKNKDKSRTSPKQSVQVFSPDSDREVEMSEEFSSTQDTNS